MKERINKWLHDNARVPSVLACGVRYPDNTFFSESYSDAFPPGRLDATWQTLADTSSFLSLSHIAATRLRWTYEQSELLFVIRPDGICLGLFTTPGTSGQDGQAVEQLLVEFAAM